jgi:hypothetical protein
MSNPDTNPRDSLDTLPNAQAPDSAGGERRPDAKGEGNVDADRRYREGVKKTIASGEVEKLAEEASDALDGAEGEELRAAEAKARKGGAGAPPPADAASSSNGRSSKNGT